MPVSSLSISYEHLHAITPHTAFTAAYRRSLSSLGMYLRHHCRGGYITFRYITACWRTMC